MENMLNQQAPNRWGVLRPIGEALRLLTAVPVPGLPPAEAAHVARAVLAFPIVGLLIGAGNYLIGLAAGWLWGDLLRSIAIVVAWMVLTLGLHLDGLADTCDALFSWRSREEKLEIMRDSRVGAMGAMALFVLLLLKFGALLALGPFWWAGAILAPLWGRWSSTYSIGWFPAAREDGLGQSIHELVSRKDCLLATASALLLGALVLMPWGALLLLPVALLGHLLTRRLVSVFGGLTGDTYGALVELSEVIVLLSLAALAHHALL